MGDQTEISDIQTDSQIVRWSFGLRLLFRFVFIYFALYCLTTQFVNDLIPLPGFEIPNIGTRWPLRGIISWSARHVFQIAQPLVIEGTGGGDKRFDWVSVFCLIMLAALGTIIWSFLDRRRNNYITLHKWFRLFIRFALASQLISYGIDKIFLLQMPFPSLARLLQPLGKLSRSGILWSSIGASQAYEIFAGSSELLAGVLLFIPRITLLGAIASFAVTLYIFVLNMTYDIAVKLFSFHLVLMALVVMAPELSRLADFLFRDRAVGRSTQPALLQSRRANRMAAIAQIALGIWITVSTIKSSVKDWNEFGGGSPKSALYGVWNVDKLWIDGELRPPLLTDNDRWRRAIFEDPTEMTFQHMDDSTAAYVAAFDLSESTFALTKRGDKNWKATFHFQRASQDQLDLDGDMDGHKVHMQLQLYDRGKFVLVNRGYHWIQEFPFNR